MSGWVVIAGLGPGDETMVTPQVRAVLDEATDVVGYIPYVRRVAERPGLTLHESDNRVELDRAAHALQMAAEGKRVVVVSSGDPGVFAMASAVFEALAEATGPVGHIACRRHNPPRAVPPSVDVVLDLMIHDIDLVLALAESPVAGIRAHAPDGIGQECCTAELTFESGLVAQLSASRLSPVVERNLIVHDDKGVWHADLVQKALCRTIGGDVHDIDVDTERDNLALEIGEFIEAVYGRRTPRVDGSAGLAALAVANDIRAAMAPLSLQLTA